MNDACGTMCELLLIISSVRVRVDERVDHRVMLTGLHVTCANKGVIFQSGQHQTARTEHIRPSCASMITQCAHDTLFAPNSLAHQPIPAANECRQGQLVNGMLCGRTVDLQFVPAG
ncbi:unnamed protein product [Sphagnum balticum]